MANLQVYRELVLDSWRARAWGDKLRVWLKPPGWRPADVAARWPKPAFDIRCVQRFDPPLARAAGWAAAGLFALALVGLSALLWHAHQLGWAEKLAGGAALIALLWLIGAITQSRSAGVQPAPMASAR